MDLIRILLYFFIGCSLASLLWATLSLAPWVPAKKKDLPRIKAALALRSGETVYDLGAGNGRVAIYLAGQTSARVVGVELALPLYLICRGRWFFSRPPRPTFIFRDFFRLDLRAANAVYVFGLPEKLAGRFSRKLLSELKPSARVVSYVFPIAAWRPVRVDKETAADLPIYIYQLADQRRL
ncbi:hypothetical protein COX69_00105 [Candidatus Falkowbacteria bacterium CG_4_10_14_0_2_um_filter_48_10]|uniref:SAM-dependent methyltransferase n=1 Tax=Candidatus Falkowbacteria bacterium CG23_combo_of_CG06-09_8_20_14_all_49_15 TaxID=1974572 RepID=A0A2G9ZNP1_9BACT|nr:MAG: hypothetical protein COX22_00300 [Candidatus Falkowbacteria bacterium CG23_combo_of_CG06-09_8_20_14_all_49_15]PJA09444.1 MAG: hypothetical protein COX69_00105 [Candidatus Falkowbacteria bacterium CG_4_10_14_0_2_um_filter_48_10]